ncbi:MAG: aldo/keto reductase [Candidatus Sumerlaeota bacterium]|nr:aldo/keto reductase [Candidatus Sumerlaeota bacterium]
MEYVRLGKTGLKVSRLCLGCMSYGDPAWRPWVLGEDAARQHIRRALDAGINFFDTADLYSLGASETITGKLLCEMAPREDYVIATKVYNRMAEGPNRGGLSRKHVIAGCEDSLRRLGLDYIDLYQIHRFDHETPIEETLDALDALVRAGKVRYLGASSMAAWEFAKALFLADQRGWSRFVSMQNHYNLAYREEEREMIPLCINQGVAVIPWSPLARGFLSGERTRDAPRPTLRARTDAFADGLYYREEDFRVLDAVVQLAAERGWTPAQAALAWMLSLPWVTAPIIGTTRLEHLDEALATLGARLTDDEIARLEAPYQPHAVLGHENPSPRKAFSSR